MTLVKFRYRLQWPKDKSILYVFFDIEHLESGAFIKEYKGWTILNRDIFTGLHDKNGKEIYESDLVKTDYGKVFQIVYYKNGFYLDDGLHSQFNEEKIEVVGDIHDNPNLVDIKN